jgi:hypothetical protein
MRQGAHLSGDAARRYLHDRKPLDGAGPSGADRLEARPNAAAAQTEVTPFEGVGQVGVTCRIPGRSRTGDCQLFRLMLYPTELLDGEIGRTD